MKLTDISVKNLMRRKAKAGFVMAGLVVGVAAMVAVIGFSRSMTTAINDRMERYGANILVLPKTEDLQLSYGGLNLGGVSFDVQPMAQADLENLKTIKNAANVAAVGPALLDVVQIEQKQVLLAGIDFTSVRTRVSIRPPMTETSENLVHAGRSRNCVYGSQNSASVIYVNTCWKKPTNERVRCSFVPGWPKPSRKRRPSLNRAATSSVTLLRPTTFAGTPT